MSTESNKNTSRRFLEEVFSKGQLAAIDEIFAANHENHGPGALPGTPRGPAGVRRLVEVYRQAFPDLHVTIDEQIAEGDLVMTRWTADGTHKGELMGAGIPITGREATVTGVTVDRFAGGKIIDSWSIFDQMGMLQQLGVIQPQRQARQ